MWRSVLLFALVAGLALTRPWERVWPSLRDDGMTLTFVDESGMERGAAIGPDVPVPDWVPVPVESHRVDGAIFDEDAETLVSGTVEYVASGSDSAAFQSVSVALEAAGYGVHEMTSAADRRMGIRSAAVGVKPDERRQIAYSIENGRIILVFHEFKDGAKLPAWVRREEN